MVEKDENHFCPSANKCVWIMSHVNGTIWTNA